MSKILTPEINENIAVVAIPDKTFNYSIVEKFKKLLVELLENPNVKKIVLDLSNVEYIDSLGLGALAHANYTCQKNNVAVALCGLRPMITKIFETARIESIFQIHTKLEEACLL